VVQTPSNKPQETLRRNAEKKKKPKRKKKIAMSSQLTKALAEAIHVIGHDFCDQHDICLFGVEPDGNFRDNAEFHIESHYTGGTTFKYRITRQDPETQAPLPLQTEHVATFMEHFLHWTLEGFIPDGVVFQEVRGCTPEALEIAFWIDDWDVLNNWFEARV
jgi:hypothetical protein